MMIGKHFLRVSLLLVIATVLPCMALAQARDEKPAGEQPRPAPQDDASRKASNGKSIEELSTEVEKLHALLEQQQRVLEQLQKRLDETDSKARTAAMVSPKTDAVVEPRAAAVEVNQAPKSATVASPPPSQDKPVVMAGWDKNHAFLRNADGSFVTQLTGFAHFDFRGYQSGNHPPNTFLVRRARLALEGKLDRYFDFKIEGDFADTTSTLLRDFYINIHRVDELQFRFGQFKEPFSQEELRPDIYQDFVERSLVNNLSPSRSPGLMVSGVINKGVFEYQVGTFNGKGLLAPNNNGTPESAVRLRFAPWKNSKDSFAQGLAFGGAFAQGRSFGGASVRGLTESRSISYFLPDAVNGKIIRANGEMTFVYGPMAIRAEYDQTNQERENLGPGGRNLPGVVAKGYMAQATYVVTGEAKPDAGMVSPRHNLFGNESGKLGFGAWELKFRYSDLQIADGTSRSNRAQTIFFGPNWYMNRFVKYVLDLGFERFNDPLRSPNPRDRNYFVVLSRIQVAF